MHIELIRDLFFWCFVLNSALLAIALFVFVAAKDWIYNIHTRFFPLNRQTHSAMLYGFLGIYKLLILVFNLVPYLALLILSA